MSCKYVLFFDAISKDDIVLVGGKGANLGEMVKSGFPVPGGFCVTTAAFQQFLHINQLSDYVVEMLRDISPENLSHVGSSLRERLQRAIIPDDIIREIVAAWEAVGSHDPYAVRSSATAEDLPFASFAGQQDTYLNIIGEQSLLDSVRNCWASLFTDRAILYRKQNGIDHAQVSISVVVQKMIHPDASGIMFTADPVSGHRGKISIDASYGLGEALVSGLVSPDIYHVNKHDCKIESKTIAEKKLAILPLKEGGTEKVEIKGSKSTAQVLSDDQIQSLADIGKRIETHYQCPQDIEWCLENGALYVVQSRAITSLFPLPAPKPQDEGLHIYFSIGHFQNMMEPISRMGLDIIRMMIRIDGDLRVENGNKTLTTAAGRLFIDISRMLKMRRTRDMMAGILSNVDSLSANAITLLSHRKDYLAQIRRTHGGLGGIIRFLLPVVLKTISNLVFNNPEGTIGRVNGMIEKYERQWQGLRSPLLTNLERLDAIVNSANFIPVFVPHFMPLVAPGVISFRLLSTLEQKWLGTNELVNQLSQGLEGNITTEAGLLLGDLADEVRRSPELLAAFENMDHESLIKRIDQIEGQEQFKQNFRSYLEKHGTRGVGEIDIARERWSESPSLLIHSLLAIVHSAKEGSHRNDYLVTAKRSQDAACELVKRIETRHGKLKGAVAARLVKVLRALYPIREHHKYLFVRLLFIIKQSLLDISVELVKQGLLKEQQDIFYVGFWELYEAVRSNTSLQTLVEQRKNEYGHFARLTPPRILTSEGEAIKAGYNRNDLSEGAMPGIAASAGVVEGIARVITNPSQERLSKGEILVAPFTDPGWTPLFVNAAGLVLEIGGLLTHGTIVAREYGIPAVVGVSDATRLIQTGQRIRVDGNAGYVVIIDEAEKP